MFGLARRAVLLPAVVAVIVATCYLVLGVVSAGEPQHRTHLELAEDGTSWPWHSSIQRAGAAWINAQPDPSGAVIEALPPENIEDLVIVATAATPGAARTAAESAASAFLDHDLALQREPFETDRNGLKSLRSELAAEFDEQEILDGQSSTDAEVVANSARLEGTAALIGRFDGDLATVRERLDAVQPRYSLISSEPVNPLAERLPESLKLLGGVFLLGWLSLAFRTGRNAG